MKEIPLSELKDHINQELTMTCIMKEHSQTFTVKIKSIDNRIRGVNMDKKCLFEIIDSKNVKFYTPK